jgi:predicted outer membrane repeat protein
MKLSALAVALSFVVVSSAAHAATTWYVDNTPGDAWNPPAGTIYATIQAGIDASAPGDTVRVYPGTYTSTGAEVVNLRGKQIVLEAAVPLVRADSATWASVDGEAARRCIVATLNETELTVVRGLWVYRGRASAGAGMYVVNGNPRIEDVWFNGNVATGGVASGGALRLLNSTSVIQDCHFESNSAGAEGGAIFNANGSIMVDSCEFFGNTAPHGGGMFTRDDASTVSGCVFRDTNWDFCCTGEKLGLGIYARDSLLAVTGSSFRNLRAANGTDSGAALQIVGQASDVLVSACEFLNNQVVSGGRGGAISVGWPGDTRGSIRILKSLFRGNFASADGGAISMQSSDRLEIDGADGIRTVFENNSANRYGGAISVNADWVNESTFRLDDSRFVSNGAGVAGGAVYIQQQGYPPATSRILTDSVFITNSAANGGALFLQGTSVRSQLGHTVYCGNDPNDIQGSYVDIATNCFTTRCVDTDNNGVPDTCEIPITDCNNNGIDDTEELVGNDVNNNGVPDDCESLDFAGLETEILPITDSVSGLPTSAVCWRVYAKFTDPAASVTAIFGNAARPLSVSAAAGFYQSPLGGDTVESIPCNSTDASLRYDSFFTIEAQCQNQTELLMTPGLSFASFNTDTNSSFSTNDGALYVLPGSSSSRAGKDLRVLLMQLTTKSAAKPVASINLTGDNAQSSKNNEWYAYSLSIPDPAMVDCNGNHINDAFDIASGTSRDCDLNGVPDSCESADLVADCDGDGIPNACEIRAGTAVDANNNGIPDNCECQGDIDHNGVVNVDDLLDLFAAWGDPNPGEADVTGDGVVNSRDLAALIANWGACS